MFFVSLGDGDNVEMLSEHHTAITYNAQSQAGGYAESLDWLGGMTVGEFCMDGQDEWDYGLEWDDGAPYQVRGDPVSGSGQAVIFAKSRLFPVICDHLSRALGRGGEVNGAAREV